LKRFKTKVKKKEKKTSQTLSSLSPSLSSQPVRPSNPTRPASPFSLLFPTRADLRPSTPQAAQLAYAASISLALFLFFFRSLPAGARLDRPPPPADPFPLPCSQPQRAAGRSPASPAPSLLQTSNQYALKPGFTPPPLLSSVSPQSSAPLNTLCHRSPPLAINGRLGTVAAPSPSLVL
jgi:hypothetical protein